MLFSCRDLLLFVVYAVRDDNIVLFCCDVVVLF